MRLAVIPRALFVVAVASAPAPAQAQPSGAEILKRADQGANWFSDAIFDTRMRIGSAGGFESREFAFTTYQKMPDKRLIVFTSPGDVKGMGVLVENAETMYVYLPGFQRVRRLGTHVNKQSFMGSDFSSEDMAQIEYGSTYETTSVTTEGNTYVVDLTLKRGKDGEFPRLKVWVDKTMWQPVRFEYYDAGGHKLKSQIRSEYVHDPGDHFGARKIVMIDHRRGDHTTEIRVVGAKFNSGLADDLFSVRSLERGR